MPQHSRGLDGRTEHILVLSEWDKALSRSLCLRGAMKVTRGLYPQDDALVKFP
jgi:hypothetical protein